MSTDRQPELDPDPPSEPDEDTVDWDAVEEARYDMACKRYHRELEDGEI